MSRKIKYTDEPMELEVIPNFLPPPEELVLKEDGVKVTISLSRRSVDFFKAAAARNHTSYQRMIRRLLDRYADRYTAKQVTHSGEHRKASRHSA
jgi:hypothetical protein